MLKILYVIPFLAVSYVFMKNAMHMFQQNRYEFYRYTKWLMSFKAFFLKEAVIYSILMVVSCFIPNVYFRHIAVFVVSIAMAIYLIEKESKNEYIKPLVYTARVKRTYVLYYVFEILFVLALLNIFTKNIGIVGILSIFGSYLVIYIAALVILPVEKLVKKYYENDAVKILDSNTDLIKIGITGSYGKTTTKNIVTDILSDHFYTLMTPASYNTPMGITRTIRSELKNIHEVFVCEMGADHVGDIKYLMKMVRPKYGIVSSIGPQHLNTFGNIGNIIHEKMQEIEMLPPDGVGIINLDNEYIANYPIHNICKIVSVGVKNEKADLFARNIEYGRNGSSFDVTVNNEIYHFSTKLLGEHNITNILCAIALALELGIDIKDIQSSVSGLKQVEHRLELKKINGFSFIDDAFNSNPSGCLSALNTLSIMPGKRVIVTPGLIDLGAQEKKTNYDFGKNMIGKCDYVILVGKNQTAPIYKGLQDYGFDMSNVLVVDKVKDAFDYIYHYCTPQDTILLENDLPDAFSH